MGLLLVKVLVEVLAKPKKRATCLPGPALFPILVTTQPLSVIERVRGIGVIALSIETRLETVVVRCLSCRPCAGRCQEPPHHRVHPMSD